MAQRTDPLKTIDTAVRSFDGVSTVINVASLHALGYQLPIGMPFRTVPTVQWGEGEVSSYGTVTNLSQDYLALISEQGHEYAFRLDPILAVSGKNIITRRYVAKGSVSGTVKESFSQDDYEVTISGVLIGENAEELNDMVQELRTILECGESLSVVNDALNTGYGITRLVVESYQFPHTKGLTNQSYTIKCYSDSSINILEEV